jgi:hypothetical protein
MVYFRAINPNFDIWWFFVYFQPFGISDGLRVPMYQEKSWKNQPWLSPGACYGDDAVVADPQVLGLGEDDLRVAVGAALKVGGRSLAVLEPM